MSAARGGLQGVPRGPSRGAAPQGRSRAAAPQGGASAPPARGAAPTYRTLHACRAGAASLVVLFHLGGTFASPKYFGMPGFDLAFGWGDAGVEFFFVLSGFLISTAHWKDLNRPQRLGAYLYRRAVRIYPTYWIVCAAVCLSALAVPALRSVLPPDAPTLLKSLALVPQDPAVVGGTGSPILFVAWTLQYEVLFYTVAAVAIVSRHAGAAVVATVVLIDLACALGSGCRYPASFLQAPLIALFAIGVACAGVVARDWRLPAPRAVAAAAVLAFVTMGAFEMAHGRDALPVDRRLVYGAISGVIIVALAQAEREGRWRATGAWVKPLGDASYALYLLHIPIISLACKLLPRARPDQEDPAPGPGEANAPAPSAQGASVSGPLTGIAAFAAVYALCLAVSTAYHLRIERPMLAFLADAARRHGPIPGGRHGTVPGTTQGTIPGNAEGLGHRGVAPTRGGGA